MMDDPPRALVQECRLFSGVQSYFVQFVLAVVALSTLWYKRTVERPKRSFEIWSLDVGKQGLGVSDLSILTAKHPTLTEYVYIARPSSDTWPIS